VRNRLEVFRKRASFVGVDFDMSLRQRGMNEETLKREILEALIYERVMFHGVTASDAEVEALFQRKKAQFAIPAQVRISQITVDSREALQRAQNELNGNAQFAVVAQTYSKDMFKDAGGVVPAPLSLPVPPGGPVAAEVVAAAFKLKEGQISEPRQIGSTWVIVRLDEKIEAKEPKLDDFRELVRGEVLQQKAETSGRLGENQASILRAVQSAQITVNRPEYQGIGEMMKQALSQGIAPGPGGSPIPASASGGVTPGHEGHDHGPLPPPPPGR
jgi:parvulin-like peptidyl-prolyl isomerase